MKLVVALAVCAVACSARHAPTPDERAAAGAAFDRYRRPDLVVAALGLRDGDRVADVGAGAGYLTFRLARAVGPRGHVVATDVDPEALATLRAHAPAPGEAPVEARRVAPDDPGLGDGNYDLILLSEVDHVLPDRAAWLRRARARLAPTGRIAVCNRRPYRDALLDAARAAGLRLDGEYGGLPAHFLVFLRVER